MEGRIYLKKGEGLFFNNATGLAYPTFTSGFRGDAMRGTEGRGAWMRASAAYYWTASQVYPRPFQG